MNQLEQIIFKISNSLEIIDSATDAMEQGNKNKAVALNSAAYDYLEMILNEFDDSFKVAWNETITKLNNSALDAWNVKVQKDVVTDDLFIDLPKPLCDSINLDEGDQLLWEQNIGVEDSWTIKKLNCTIN
jgi:hypothetical protein